MENQAQQIWASLNEEQKQLLDSLVDNVRLLGQIALGLISFVESNHQSWQDLVGKLEERIKELEIDLGTARTTNENLKNTNLSLNRRISELELKLELLEQQCAQVTLDWATAARLVEVAENKIDLVPNKRLKFSFALFSALARRTLGDEIPPSTLEALVDTTGAAVQMNDRSYAATIDFITPNPRRGSRRGSVALVSGGLRGPVFWDINNGKALFEFSRLGSDIVKLDVSDNGERILAISTDGSVHAWYGQSSKSSPNPTLVAPGGRKDPSDAQNSMEEFDIATSSSGDLVLVAGNDDNTTVAKFWKSFQGGNPILLKGHKATIHAVAIGPGEDPFLATGGSDNKIFVWDTNGKRKAEIQGHQDRILDLAFEPKGRLIASSGADRIIRFWNIRDGSLFRELEGHTGAVKQITFDPSGHFLASCTAEELFVWDLCKEKISYRVDLGAKGIESISWGVGGYLAASLKDGRILLLYLDIHSIIEYALTRIPDIGLWHNDECERHFGTTCPLLR